MTRSGAWLPVLLLSASATLAPGLAPRAAAQDGASAGAGKDGFVLKSADGDFQFRLRGTLHVDGRFWSDDELKPQTDTFLVRRARPYFEVTVFKIYDVRIMPDFGAGTTALQDAYLEARFHAAAKLRAGKFKVPFGLERLQSATDMLFVERALPSNLAPNRDIGLQIGGEAADGVFGYAAGIFNGAPDGTSADADNNDGKDLAARIWFQPFRKTSVRSLTGLGFGVAATRGTSRGTPASTGLAGFRTPGQATFFSYLAPAAPATPTAADTVVASGRRLRLSPQLYYSVGRFGLLGEYVKASHEVTIDVNRAELEHTAWQATASFFLTPDQAAYKGASPKRPFGPGTGAEGPGAIELVARIGALEVDEDAFPTFASPTASARKAEEKGMGVNWYLNRNVKAVVDYVETEFTGGGAGGTDREAEKVFLTRFQFSF